MATTEVPQEESSSTPIRGLKKKGRLEIDRLFEALVRLQGSDLHLKVGQPPFIRVKGSLQPLKHDKLDDEAMQRLCFAMLDERQKRILDLVVQLKGDPKPLTQGEDLVACWPIYGQINIPIHLATLHLARRRVVPYLVLTKKQERLSMSDRDMGSQHLIGGLGEKGRLPSIANGYESIRVFGDEPLIERVIANPFTELTSGRISRHRHKSNLQLINLTSK